MRKSCGCIPGPYDPLSDVLSRELDTGEERRKAQDWAEEARRHAEAAAQSEAAVGAGVEDARASRDAAKASEAAAEAAADRAEKTLQNAQVAAKGQKGYYETPDDLQAAVPAGAAGDWAIVGSTDTIWVWDDTTSAWLNSVTNIDLSDYCTKDEADDKSDELRAALEQQITDAASRIWTVPVPATAWEDGADTWAGIEAKFKAQVECEGMTAATVLAPPQYADGDLASAQAFAWVQSADGAAVLWSKVKPSADFTLTLTEVK